MNKLSFLDFTSYYLQELIIKPFASFHLELFDLAEKEKVLFCAAPRGHAKSHLFARFYLLYKLLTQPGINIILVSASEDIAKEHFSEVKRQLENNKWLKASYGEQISEKWTESHIILRNGSVARAIGAEAKFRGRRPDLIIVDDLESDSGVNSEATRKNLRNWFLKVLLNTLVPNGQLIMIGTILGEFSLLYELLHSDAWIHAKRVIYRALDKDDNPLWPEEWGKEALLEKKRIDPIAFSCEYMNNPLDDSLAIIKAEWIGDGTTTPNYFKAIILGIDPAATTKTISDYSAFCFWGVTPGTPATDDKKAEPCRIYEIESFQHRLHFPDLKDLLWSKYKEYKEKGMPLTKIVIESAHVGIPLFQNVFAEHYELNGVLEPIGHKNRDKVSRLKSVAHYFANGRVFVKSDLLRNHLRAFPRVHHDDIIDAATYGLMKIQEMNLLELEIKKESKYKDMDKEATRFWKAHDKEKRDFFEERPYHKTEEYAYLFGLDM